MPLKTANGEFINPGPHYWVKGEDRKSLMVGAYVVSTDHVLSTETGEWISHAVVGVPNEDFTQVQFVSISMVGSPGGWDMVGTVKPIELIPGRVNGPIEEMPYEEFYDPTLLRGEGLALPDLRPFLEIMGERTGEMVMVVLNRDEYPQPGGRLAEAIASGRLLNANNSGPSNFAWFVGPELWEVFKTTETDVME